MASVVFRRPVRTFFLYIIPFVLIMMLTRSVHHKLYVPQSQAVSASHTNMDMIRSGHISDELNILLHRSKPLPRQPAEVDQEEYRKRLIAHASQNNIIFLSMVDSAFLPMALNFHETSLLANDITNYLFIASDIDSCLKLLRLEIHCYVYMEDDNAKRDTLYQSRAFNIKMKIRTYMILDALKMGFTVVHTDTDMWYAHNPLSYISCTDNCHLATLMDMSAYNAGFVYVRPTTIGLAVYENMKQTALKSNLDDQKALNRAIQALKLDKQTALPLDAKHFQCGKRFFQITPRAFADSEPCPECVVVHNNWIVSLEAKRYRFREMHMWLYDDVNGYYTNKERLYLTYTNSGHLADKNYQLGELTTALYIAQTLNRTLIIPKMHCKTSECGLNSFINIRHFDTTAGFYYKYRESSFLSHPKVPESTRNGITRQIYCIKTKVSSNFTSTDDQKMLENVEYLKSRDIDDGGATLDEILAWFGDITAPVLRLGPVHGVFGQNHFPPSDKEFSHKINEGIISSSYNQIESKHP